MNLLPIVLKPSETQQPLKSCGICNSPFSIRKKKRVCQSCRRLVCKQHSGNKPKSAQVLCDNCRISVCAEQVTEETRPLISQLAQTLRDLRTQQELKLTKNKAVEDRLAQIELKATELPSNHQLLSNSLNEAVETQKSANDSLEAQLVALTTLHSAAQHKTQKTEEYFISLQNALAFEHQPHDALSSETLHLQTELQQLSSTLNSFLRLRHCKCLCVPCYRAVKLQFAHLLLPSVPAQRHAEETQCTSCSIV